jgi:two-component system, NtrC family, sensor kinase
VKPAVLIIDDSLTVRMDLSEAFEAAGFEPTLCATLAEARAALARGPYALVVLDVQMPDGDGVEFLQELRQAPLTAGVPIMLLSLKGAVQDRVRGLSQGADEYVGKPYDSAYVTARAHQLVQGHKPAAPRAEPLVLIIDDSLTMRQTLRALLEDQGYQVALAACGEEGLSVAAQRRPDLVVVDGTLPDIAGTDVIRRLRSDVIFGRTPCLLLTAAEGREEQLRALDAGADAYLRKSEGTQMIRARVAALLRDRQQAPAWSEHAAGASLLGPKKILVIDDSPQFLEELAVQLQRHGYDIVTASSAKEALDLLAVQRVDCILLDVVMPDMSGRELCQRVKSTPAWRDIPLLLLTGYDDMPTTLSGLELGADDYIVKSGDFEMLNARLHAQLRRKSFADGDRRQRERLEKAVRDRDEFLSLISHELRTPLTSLKLLSQTALRRARAAPDAGGAAAVGDLLERMQGQIDRYEQLIDQLTMISQISLGSLDLAPAELELGAVLREVGARFGKAPHAGPVTFTGPAAADPVVGRWDRRCLEGIAYHLLHNAQKFGAGTPVEITFGRSEDKAWFTVRDSGIGIAPEDQVRIFERFERAVSEQNYGGLGLGLWLVKQLVLALRGEVSLRSRPGAGTTFRVLLPLGA